MSPRTTALLLWIMLTLFVFRVLGQLIVLLYAPPFLPPMEEWYSGLMPYRYLLPSQIAIIVLFTWINLDVSRGMGFWAQPRQKLGTWLRNFGLVYLVAMVVRYILRMSLYPEERWFGGTIPIFFHWVLATYIILLGMHCQRRAEAY